MRISHLLFRRAHPAPAGRGQRGAVLVEFAFVFPILAVLLVGLVSAGLVLNRRASAFQAAREGARYGATVPFDQCTPTTLCGGDDWVGLVQDLTVARSHGEVDASQVCVALVEGSGTAPVAISTGHTTASGTAPCFADDSPDPGRRVQVVISYGDQIEAVFTTASVDVNARAVSKLES